MSALSTTTAALAASFAILSAAAQTAAPTYNSIASLLPSGSRNALTLDMQRGLVHTSAPAATYNMLAGTVCPAGKPQDAACSKTDPADTVALLARDAYEFKQQHPDTDMTGAHILTRQQKAPQLFIPSLETYKVIPLFKREKPALPLGYDH